ncbi:MAG: response regulator [Thermodesulfobacteriota bacterium]
MTRIMIVEDESIIALDLKNQVQSLGYDVCTLADSGEKALTLAETEKPDLLLMDIVLHGPLDGIEAAGRIRSRLAVPIIFITAHLDEDKLDRAKPILPLGYLFKPIQLRDLKVVIEMALYTAGLEKERSRTELELARHRLHLEELVRERTVELQRVKENLEQDIIARQRTEEDLKRSEERFRLALRNSLLTVFHLDLDLRITWIYNPHPNFSSSRIVGRRVDELIPPGQENVTLAFYQAVLNTGLGGRKEFSYDFTGNFRAFDVVVEPLRGPAGEVVGLTVAAADVTLYKNTQRALLLKEMELTGQASRLAEANTALKVLLEHWQQQKVEQEKNILASLRKLVMPFVDKLKQSGLKEDQQALLSIVESNLKTVTSPLASALSSPEINLTPAEIQITEMIREGRSTKEIASLLNLSADTVATHRKNIRAKMGLTRKGMNLKTYLEFLHRQP